MALMSKNFLFRRKNKNGDVYDFKDSDSFYNQHPDYQWSEISLPLPASGYYGSTSGLHTMAFTLRNFVGRIAVQGTLASNPKEEDWFYLPFNGCCSVYKQFDDQEMNCICSSDRYNLYHGTTGTFMESVVGNFTFLRVCIERDYITEKPNINQQEIAGKLEEVLINF